MIVRLPVGIKIGETFVKEVTLKPLDGFSRQIIMNPEYKSAPAKMTNVLLQHCIQEIAGAKPTEEQIRNMFTADRNALMMYLQKISVGNEVKARYICSWCNEGAETVENLDSINFTEWDEPKSTIDLELKTGYTDKDGVCHKQVTLEIPTGIDEEIAGHYLRSNYGEWCNVMIARKIVKFGTLDMRQFAGLGIKIVQTLNVKDIDYMIESLTVKLPGFVLKHDIVCSMCGRVSSHILDMTYFF